MWLKLPETPHTIWSAETNQGGDKESACASRLSVSAPPNPAADPNSILYFHTASQSGPPSFVASHIYKIYQTLTEKPCRACLTDARLPLDGGAEDTSEPRRFRSLSSANWKTCCRPLAAEKLPILVTVQRQPIATPITRMLASDEAQEGTNLSLTQADCFQFPNERQGSIGRSG